MRKKKDARFKAACKREGNKSDAGVGTDASTGEPDASNDRLNHIYRVLLGIRNVNQLIVSEDDPRRLIEKACVNLTETMGYHNAWIALLGGEAAGGLGLSEPGPVAAAAAAGFDGGFDGGFERLRERLDQGEFPDCMNRAMEGKDTHVVNDPAADCPGCPLHSEYGGRAGLARRLVFDGVTFGVLTASVPAAYARDAEEQDLFNEVADDLGFALHKIAATRRHEQSQQRMSLVIEGSGLGTWEWNVQTNETVFNEQWAAMLGYTLEELTPYDYTTWERLVHPEDLPRASRALADCVEGRTTDYTCEFRMKHKDGHWVWILDRGRVMTRNDEGKPLSMFGTHTDITEIKQAEEEARNERDLSRSIIDHGPLGITIVNRDGVVEFANRLAEDVLGLSKSAIRGRTYNDADWEITAVDGTQFPDEHLPVHRVLRTGEAVHRVQHAIVWPNGQRRILSVNAAPLKNQEGCIDRIVCTIEDITERKEAEEALTESERRFQRMLGVVPDMISIHSPEMDILYSNWHGFAAVPEDNRLVNTKCYKTYRGLDGLCPGCRAVTVLESREPIHEEAELPDGTWVDLRVIPLLDKDNNVEMFMEWVRDITEQKQAEKERQRLGAQLTQSQKMESVGRLAGGVAHDFNNMLSVILGHSQMMLAHVPYNSPLRGDLDQIQKAAERSANLTRQLLAFARKQTVAPKVLDLNETIASMLRMLERLIGEDVDLLWKPGGRLAPVRIDPGQVDQMLANLTVNARDAIGHANGKITIETANICFDDAYCAAHAGFLPGDYVMLAVSDDGCGMDEETRANIFEPFFTTKGVGEGTGLGLATVYGIVKQNGGFANVYSEPGNGTTFRIYLPAIEAGSSYKTKASRSDAAPMGGHETILVVEDEAAILSLARAMLERLGYTVLTASVPGEALRVMREYDCKMHLLITDVVMPEMNGRTLSEELQSLCPDLKTLFMSGYTANVIAHHSVLDEGVDFIQKPFSPNELCRKVREVLDK
ncbi:MAG: PAS domain S-box protein [Phycisphaerae bacterium]